VRDGRQLVLRNSGPIELVNCCLFVPTEHHVLNFFDVLNILSLIHKLLNKSGTRIPLRFLTALLIEPRHIRNKLETIARVQGFLKELRIDVCPCKFGRILQYEVDVLLETLMEYEIE
jgi:hypothetical protein